MTCNFLYKVAFYLGDTRFVLAELFPSKKGGRKEKR